MGLIRRILGMEKRAESVRLSDPYLAEFLGARGIGAHVSPDAVVSNLAVAARCIGLRAELIASVGLHLFRRTDDGGRVRADDNPLYGVLHDLANPHMTAYEAREFLCRSLDTVGNAYARIERNARGQVIEIYPLLPRAVTVEKLASGRLRYRVAGERGGSYVLLQEEMLHIRGPSRDGIVGLSPVQVAAGALGLALAHREAATALQRNALRPFGIISFDTSLVGSGTSSLSAEQFEIVKQGLREKYQGGENAGRPFFTTAPIKWQPISMTPEDAEFLENLKLGNEDVARVYGMPPTTVGITDKATYSNTEQESRALVQNAIGPLAKRFETAMFRCLLTETGRRTLYVEHDLDTLLRGDVQARFEAYRIGREIGALSPNDIRRRENDPPIPGGDIYHQPANWVPLGTSAAANAAEV